MVSLGNGVSEFIIKKRLRMRPYWIGMENPISIETRRNIKDVQIHM